MRYIRGANSVVDAIDKLDAGLYNLGHDIGQLCHYFEGGTASAAALSVLQPNFVLPEIHN